MKVRKLRRREHREESGLTIVEGEPEVRRAARAGVRFRDLYICPDIFTAPPGEIPAENVILIPREDFAKIAFGSRLKGILGLAEMPVRRLNDLKLSRAPLVMVLEGIEKPGNFGTIIRACDGAGVDAIIACQCRTDLANPNVVRSSTGTVFTIPCFSASLEETLDYLEKHKIPLLASTSGAEMIYSQADFRGPCAIAVGGEHEGLSPAFLSRARDCLRIPMFGDASCLNAGISASILIYEARRQREDSQ